MFYAFESYEEMIEAMLELFGCTREEELTIEEIPQVVDRSNIKAPY